MMDDDKSSGDLGSFLRIFRYARPYWWTLALAVTVLGLSSLTGVWSAAALGKLVDQGLMKKDFSAAYRFGAWVLGLELASLAASYVGSRMTAETTNASLFLIRQKLFTHLNTLPMRYFDSQPLGKTVTRMTYDVEGLEDFFGGTLARLLNAVLTIFIVVGGMLAINFRLGAVIVLSMIPAGIVTWATRNPVRHWNREFSRRNSAINATLSEFLNGIPVIRYFGAEAWSAERFDDVVDSHLESAVRINVLNSWVRPVVLLLCAMPRVVLLYFGGQAVLAGTLGVGVFVAFIRFTERFSRPISAIAQEIQTIQAAFTSAERVSRFLDNATELEALGEDGQYRAPHMKGAIEFRGVSMGYDEKQPVLRDINFEIRAGEKIGLAGRTGSGKSTTAALLSRLYEFQAGTILVDGISIRDYQRESLRAHIGFVNQDVTIFRGTLFENLAFGAAISRQVTMEACAKTGLETLLVQRDFNLDSLVLDHGTNLSAGEKQLIALTRVLLRNPSVLILDEATANVDEAYEDILQRAVLSVMTDRTCLMIAHRLTTLEACNRIFVFKDGMIVEEGPHAELLARGGYYSRLIFESRSMAADGAPVVV